MTAHEYAFVVVATIGSIAAVAVVTARNVVHAALYLVVTLASARISSSGSPGSGSRRSRSP